MKTYQLTQNWNGVAKSTQLFGPFRIQSSSGYGYFRKEDIPPEGQPGTNAFFSSAIEADPSTFQDVTDSQPTKNPA